MPHDDRTEKPTPKRRKEARREGRIPRSPDISTWLVLLVGSELVPHIFSGADKKITQLFAQSNQVVANPSTAAMMAVLEKGFGDLASIVFPAAGIFVAVGICANVAQSGVALSLHAAAPKWNRLNPITGVKNLFSIQSVWQLGKQILKLLALVGIAYEVVSHLAHTLVGSQPVDMTPIVKDAGSTLLGLGRDVAAIGVLLGIVDYAWQRRRIGKMLKMTKQEVKEESRQSEGDPIIRGQIRRKMLRMSRTRMMAAVAGADVVVVNPTHFAVALRYDPSQGLAPVVVAKGVDDLALRIREEACNQKVPVIEDPPLARAVYAACDLDEAIPAELFLAVARLLAFVFNLSPIVRAAGLVHRRPASALVA